MGGRAVRASDIWTVYEGRPRRVVGRVDGETIRLRDDVPPPTTIHEVPVAEVGPIEKVLTEATWRGSRVVVGHALAPGVVAIFVNDAELAARESLHGDQYSGWGAAADVEELSDVTEAVTVLRNEGKQP